ncbi:MAG: hypothetical protein ACRC80_11575 [Waterburya sp.]
MNNSILTTEILTICGQFVAALPSFDEPFSKDAFASHLNKSGKKKNLNKIWDALIKEGFLFADDDFNCFSKKGFQALNEATIEENKEVVENHVEIVEVDPRQFNISKIRQSSIPTLISLATSWGVDEQISLDAKKPEIVAILVAHFLHLNPNKPGHEDLSNEMSEIVKADIPKSEKMRKLFDLGLKPAQIAREIDAHPSFVHSTIQSYRMKKALEEKPMIVTKTGRNVKPTESVKG